MGHEFFKSQIGVSHENFKVYGVGHYNFQCQIGGGSCTYICRKIRGGPHKISLLIIKFLLPPPPILYDQSLIR